MSDFSKFCFKPQKADADILKKYIQTDFKNDLLQLANKTERRQRGI